jgi:hypothetical protein
MKRRRWFILRRVALGLTVAAIAPATAHASPADFWNYDPQTGKKVANSSPSVSSGELATLWSGSSGVAKSPDDRAFSRATNVVQVKPADFWNYDPQTGKKVANSSPSVSSGELANLWSSSGTTDVATAPSAHDNGGYDLSAGVVSGLAMALVLAAGAALLVIRHLRTANVSPA